MSVSLREFNPQSMDAMDWVKEFNRIEVSKGLQPTSPEWMLGWFANAIMAGYDEARRRYEKPQLTEEELEKILPKKKEMPVSLLHKCMKCGADDLLHQAETEFCPKNGREAPINRKQEWEKTTYTPNDFSAINVYNQTIDDCKSALIGKCAIPTFSGEVIDKTKSVGCNTCEYEERICITPCTYKKKPTEQKECLHDGDKIGGSDCPIICCKCGKELFNKPIPAEKKEEKRFGDICLNCGCEKILHNCPECGMKQPEPKPKDRIEEMYQQYPLIERIEKKLDYLIRHINKES